MNQVKRSSFRAEDGHLIRPRLLDIVQGGSSRLTILVAPGGFGKTTLLSDYVRLGNVPNVWLTLNEWDRDAETFANRLVTAMNGILETTVAPMAPSSQIDDREGWARAITDRLLASFPTTPSAVILDDYQEGEGDEGSRVLLETLVLRLPPTARVFIASRSMPRLSALPRLLSRGEAIVIDTPVLKFTKDELVELAEMSGNPDPQEAAERLWATTNGWPAAVTIAVRSPARDSEVGPGSPELLLRHLIDESLADLDREELDTVLRLSAFESMTESLCRRVHGLSFDEGLLSWLASTGLPISSAIEEGVATYRFHPLLREHLLRRLSRDLAAYRKAEQDAAQAYLGAGQTLQALQHFVRADDSESLLAHTPRVVANLLRTGRWSAAVRLFTQMPPSWLDAYPEFRLLFGRALFWSGDSDAALEQIALLLGAVFEPELLVQALALRAGALRKKGEYDAALAACNEALRVASRADVGEADVLEVRRELGFTLGMQGDLAAATEHLTACLTHFEVVQDRENAARIRDGLGVIHGQMGDLASAAAHLRKALQYWDKLDNPAAASNTHNNVGMVLYKRGEAEEARTEFVHAVEAARLGGNRHIEGFAESSLGDLDLDAGDFASASKRFQRSLAVARELDSGNMASYAQAGLGRAYFGQGQLRKADVTLAEAAAETRARGGRAELAPILVLLARTRMALGVQDDVENLLREAVGLAAQAPEEEARARLWLAEALLRHGTKRNAIEELQHIDEIGAKAPIWEMVEHEVPHLPRLANYASSRLGAGSRLARILRAQLNATDPGAGEPAESAVEVRLLGNLRVTVNGTVVEGMAWRTRRAKELFAYFLLEGARTRREICLALWPDDPPETVARTFKVTLHRLRNAIAPVQIELHGDRHEIVSPQPIWCDALEFRLLVRQARSETDGDRRSDLLRRGAALYRGPFAKEFDSDWAEQARSTLEDAYVSCLTELAQAAAASSDHAVAISYCEIILSIDALNDGAAVQLMLSNAALGQAAAVGDIFNRYRRRIHAEGLEPSPAVVRLYKQLQTSA